MTAANLTPLNRENYVEERNDKLVLYDNIHCRSEDGLVVYSLSQDHRSRISICMEKIKSFTPGFGTASARKIVKISLENGGEGRYHATAVDSSHLFHLYMGLVPIDRKSSLVSHKWGLLGYFAVKNYNTIQDKLQKNVGLTIQELSDLKFLKMILADLNGLNHDQITNVMVSESQKEIDEIKSQTFSYFTQDFIPRLLNILKRSATKKQPDTSELLTRDMYLSDEGLTRWKDAIAQQKPFVPFRKLEHLRPFMDADQLTQLDEIMAIREKALGVKQE